MLHAVLLYIHLLGIVAAIAAMLVSENIIYRKYDRFSNSDAQLVDQLSTVIKVSLAFLWLSGIGLVYVGQMTNPVYLANEKIWAKIIIVAIVTLNGVYISNRIMPRVKALSHTKTLVNSLFESFMFRLSFAVSVTGWMVAMFFGTARFMNYSFDFVLLVVLYAAVVLLVVLASYIIRNVDFLRPNRMRPLK